MRRLTVRWCIGKATAIGMISNELGLPLRQIASNSYERDLTVCRAQEQHILLARCLDELGVKRNVAGERRRRSTSHRYSLSSPTDGETS